MRFWPLVLDMKENTFLHSKFIKKIVAKALDGQRYPLPLCEYVMMCDGERGSGPEGADDLCYFYLSLEAGIGAFKLGFALRGRDLSLLALIPSLRPK